tara:strand:+ start:1143 stop:1373 length:231 start_codon:yes stop_codon:yes gene_type:complete
MGAALVLIAMRATFPFPKLPLPRTLEESPLPLEPNRNSGVVFLRTGLGIFFSRLDSNFGVMRELFVSGIEFFGGQS